MIDGKTLEKLRQPFAPEQVYFKPGSFSQKSGKAMALAYADLRAYQNRLDEIVGGNWEVRYHSWGDKLVCELTICGTTRSSIGEPDTLSEQREIDGTVAEAQAFKRAAAAFGLGRYIYEMPDLWAEYDSKAKRFTENGKAYLRKEYRRIYDALMGNASAPKAKTEPLYALAKQFYGNDHWQSELFRISEVVSKGRTKDPEALTQAEIDVLISGLQKQIAKAEEQVEDNPFEDDLPQRPQDWRNPGDAWKWAVESGAVKELAEAKELWKDMILSNYNGKLPPSKMNKAFDDFFELCAAERA